MAVLGASRMFLPAVTANLLIFQAIRPIAKVRQLPKFSVSSNGSVRKWGTLKEYPKS